MLGHLSPVPAPRALDARAGQPALAAGAAREPRPVPAFAAAPAAAAEPAAPPAGDAGSLDAVRQAVSRAVERHAPGRDVSVDNRYDEATGRAVVRVADRRTGEVLFESPPEELLRFFASARERPGAPLIVLEA